MQLPVGVTVDCIETAEIDELLDLLGRQLVLEDPKPSGEVDRIRRANAWMLAKLATIRNAVCRPEIRKSINSEKFTVALATMDGLLAPYTGGIPVTLISAIILKTGLDKVCDDD